MGDQKSMAHSKTGLLTPTEHRDLYSIPILNDIERQEYFTFDQTELSALHHFHDVKDAVYFAITLVLFKIKRTLILFQYQDVTSERQHIMQRYFPDKRFPKSLPTKSSKNRIDLKIIEMCQAQRFNGSIEKTIQCELQEIAAYAPRQRQLLKELLHLFTKYNIVIPGHTTIQNLVISIWNQEQKRIFQAYMHYTTRKQRDAILALLKENAEATDILLIKTDLKSFHTHDLRKEIKKYTTLKAIFENAQKVIRKLNLPLTTCQYYASLIHYYNRSRMKQINSQKIGLYLLCYVFIRYQTTNDTLIDAFKKRVMEITGKANRYADEKRLKQLDQSEETRKQIFAMMLMVHKHSSTTVSKKLLYQYIREDQWIEAAYSLVDEQFNKKLLFWKYIDNLEDSIKLSIRQIFLALDFTQIKNDPLNIVIEHMKKHIEKGTMAKTPFPAAFHKWIDKKQRVHVIQNDEIIPNRFEFLMYMKIMNDLESNKITFQHSVRYKNIDDEIIDRKTWKRTKKPLLEKLDYPKLSKPMSKILADKRKESIGLYEKVNEAIKKGENTSVIVSKSKNKKGELVWRLRPIEAEPGSNEGLFANLKQHSIVDVMKFVNQHTGFMYVFESILPKGTHTTLTIEYLSAGVLANAIRMGGRKMGDASDLNESTLLTTEANYILVKNLHLATDLINNKTAKFEIFEKWYINSIVHGSLDALKLDLTFAHHKGRHSRKYFGCGLGVAGYNHIINGLSVTGNLIGAHEYEGDFTFELSTLQNTSEIKATQISTDKHGMNMFNFALFDFIEMVFTPRVPKPHREVLWGFGKPEDYEGMLIKPTKFIDEHLLIDEDDNIKRLLASFLTGHVSPTVIIKKMSSKNYSSKTKIALMHYNNMERSMHNLRMAHDPAYRYTVTMVLNRGEAYNNLYRAITLLNDGELRGKSEIEMEKWHQCTRLIAAIIHYYNTYIINTLYQRATSDEERKFLEKLSPTAWTHILLLGFYQFFNKSPENWVDEFLHQWDWRKAAKEMETSQQKNHKK